MDIISGSWPGEIFLFKGGLNRTFEAPEMIKYKNGEIINIGGGIREEPDGRILITGNAEFDRKDGKSFVTYHGKQIESTPEKPISVTGSASAVHVADWDGDGDYDLIVGTIRGEIYMIPNEGTPEAYAFGKEQKITKAASRAGPFTADWDGDGDLDLLVGVNDGSVSLFSNIGNAKSPELDSAVQLIPPGERASGSRAPKEVRRGGRSKICVTDWNGDGRLDLLVGDIAYQKPDLPEPTPEEKAEHERLRKELEPIQKRYGELVQKLHGPSRVKTIDEREKIQKEMIETSQHMMDLRSKLPREYEHHGWVWLFLRKSEN